MEELQIIQVIIFFSSVLVSEDGFIMVSDRISRNEGVLESMVVHRAVTFYGVSEDHCDWKRLECFR